jgi:hypothetical protein
MSLVDDLAVLGITPDEYNSIVDSNEKKRFIEQKYRNLARLRHPDRNRGNPNAVEEFQALKESHDRIINLLTSTELTFEHSIPESDVSFNFDDLSFFQEDAILRIYEKLITKLENADEFIRELLIQNNFEFLKLAKNINQHKEEIDRVRKTQLFNYNSTTDFFELLYRRWHLFLVKTFAKELLDDFSYRNALVTGDLQNIWALEKILNPFKLLLSSVALVECIFFAISQLAIRSFQFWSQQCQKIWQKILLLALFNLSVLWLISISSPLLFNMVFLADVITDGLELLANPFNLIIKPLSEKFNLSEELILGLVLFAGAGLALALSFNNTLTLKLIFITLDWINIYLLGSFFYNLYQISPRDCLISLSGFLYMSYSPDFFENYYAVSSNIFVDIFQEILCIGYFCKLLRMITDGNQLLAELNINLPLPKEKTNTEFVNIINQKHKTAYLSHCFFNTPKDAEFICPKGSELKLQVMAVH